MKILKPLFLSASLFTAGAAVENKTNLLFGSGEMQCSYSDDQIFRHCVQDVGLIGKAIGSLPIDYSKQ